MRRLLARALGAGMIVCMAGAAMADTAGVLKFGAAKAPGQSSIVQPIACSPSDTQACLKCVRDTGSPDKCKICAGCRN